MAAVLAPPRRALPQAPKHVPVLDVVAEEGALGRCLHEAPVHVGRDRVVPVDPAVHELDFQRLLLCVVSDASEV